MKVIFVTTESFMDHSYTMICELRKHVDLTTIFIAKKYSPEIEDFCKKINARFEKRQRFINPFRFFFEIRLLMYIRAQKADLVWFNTLSVIQAIFLKLFVRFPLISIHDIEIHPKETDLHGMLSQKLMLKLYNKGIAVMSQTQANLFSQKFGFMPYILQLPIIDYYENSKRQRKISAVKSSEVQFLFFGSILPYKGIEILLKAVEILNEKKIVFQLNVYGTVRYNYNELVNSFARLNNVKYLNQRINYQDIYEVFCNCDVVVVPYTHVTQSGPLLIGYNQNKPCIANNLPGFREYVVDHKSGLIFNNSPEDLAAKMEYLVENKYRIHQMSDFVATEIKSRFSMSSLAQSYLTVFKNHVN